MIYGGLILGDDAARRTLQVKTPDIDFRWQVFENVFRSMNGDLNRQLIKGAIPTVTMTLQAVKDADLGVLLGARAQKQEMFLKLGSGMTVVRQLETMVGVDYFYLTPSSLQNLTAIKVYEKADFDGAADLFYSYDPDTNLVTLNTMLSAGDKVYVDYSFDTMKCVCTELASKPLRGSSAQLWSVSVKFEGI